MRAFVDPFVPENAPADAAIIKRVLAGDTQAFAVIVERYQAPMHRYAASMVLNHDAAADMVQDAFVRAYTNLASCRDRDRFRAWLFQTLRNRCLDYLKEPRRRDVLLDDAGPIPDEADDPVAVVERRSTRAAVIRALARLPDAQREAFVLHYVEGVPYEAMAELLDASVSALKMRVLRAREALAVALRKEDVTDSALSRLSGRQFWGSPRSKEES
jgi:RNA polymerase sigma-70 factor, ECF subfamily